MSTFVFSFLRKILFANSVLSDTQVDPRDLKAKRKSKNKEEIDSLYDILEEGIDQQL